MERSRGWASVVLVGALLGAGPLQAQPADSGWLAGRVTDGSGAGLPGASVVACPEGGDEARSTTTDANGRYRLEGLPTGSWDVSFHLPNFAQTVSHAVAVRAGGETALDAVLQLRVTAQVVVTAPLTFRDLSTVTSDAELIGIAGAASTSTTAPTSPSPSRGCR